MTTTMTRISQFWDQIETWGFCEDINFSVLRFHTDLGFSQGHQGLQGHWPYDDDDNQEDDDEVEDNDKDDDNNKDDNNDKGISVLGLDRDLEFS